MASPNRRPWRTSIFNLKLLIILCCICWGMVSGCSSNGALTQPTASFQPVLLGPTSTIPDTPRPTQALSATPTLLPIKPINIDDHARGNPRAPVTLVVYSDFQCPSCARFFEALQEIEDQHPEDILLIFRHFPLLPVHDKADLAGAATEIAGRAGLFWEMHDALFERQAEWSDLSRPDFVDWLSRLAGELGIVEKEFRAELNTGVDQNEMLRAFQEGVEAGIPGTPFIFFNGEWYRLNPTAANLEASLRLEMIKGSQYDAPPELEIQEGKLYFAHLLLDQGEVVIQLFPRDAPSTVASFIFLAQQGWFQDFGFHHVEAGRLVETGDPTGTGLGGPGYLLLDEISPELTFDVPGMVAMSSSGPDTNGSRFFINLEPLPYLNGTRTIFGRVIRGLDLLATLDDRDPFQDLLTPYETMIHKVRIEIR